MFTRVRARGDASIRRHRAAVLRNHERDAMDGFDAVRFMRPRRWLSVDLAAFPVRVTARGDARARGGVG